MFEAYKVFVKISLINDVSKELMRLSALFGKTSRDAEKLQATLNKIKTVGLIGAGTAGVGFMGLVGIAKALKPAQDYAHQLNIMNMAGMKHQEIAEATAAAWKTAGTVLSTTATGNLKAILDLRNVFGNTEEAIEYMPEIARIGAVLKASSSSTISGNADDIAFSVAKALDIRGASQNSSLFDQQASAMAKVIIATQGRVTPEDYRMLFKYSRQATMGLSDEFLYQQLPTFMLEMKGAGGGSGSHGGFGTSLAAFYRFFVQGVMSKSALQGMKNIGLIAQNAGLRTTTTGTMLNQGEHIKDVQLAAANPFEYIQKDFLPAIFKKYGDKLTKEQLGVMINQIMKGASSTALFAVSQFAFKSLQVYRDQQLIKQAKDLNTAASLAFSNDPNTVNAALSAQWENFKTAFGMSVIPVILPGLIKLTQGLNNLAEFFRNHQAIAKDLAVSFAALFTAMAIGGTVLVVTAAFSGLAMILNPIGLSIIAVTSALYGLYKIIALFKPYMDKHPAMVGSGGYNSKADFLGIPFKNFNPHNWFSNDYLNHPVSAMHPAANTIASNSSASVQTHAQSTTQGAVYLDSHKVGSFLFGSSLSGMMNQSQLSGLNRVNASMSPLPADAGHPY